MWFLRVFFLTAIAATILSGSAPAGPAPVEFNRDIRPLLSDNCFFCHGPDKNKRKAGLRLDLRDAALKKEAFVPGKPDDSEIIKRILTKDSSDVMPPPETHKVLTAPQKDLLRRWISEGAAYQPHWAYVPVVRPVVPAVKEQIWVANPIDAFIAQRLEARDLRPSPAATAPQLLRRLTLDLTGLPPTADQLAKAETEGLSRAVDRLLASPHYGERMASPWLDVVRFADTVGYHGDQNQNIFPYRDYVIDSFNRNKPFDQFTIEQLAGDLLPNPTVEQRIATGFNRLNMVSREGGAQPKEYLAKYAADRVRAVGAAWMGTTTGCAECHDHKYDPFTSRDFYSLSAFFADIRQWGVYADYGSSPNADLKNWTNDHPFPPELTVENVYLKKRLISLRQQQDDLGDQVMRKLNDPGLRTVAAAWQTDMRAYLKKYPDGFAPVSPRFVWAGKDERSTLDGDVIVFDGEGEGQGRALEVAAPPGALSSMRLELIPRPEHQGQILRRDTGSAKVSVALSVVRAAGLDSQIVPIAFADADNKTTRYEQMAVVHGVATGWQTVAGLRDHRHAAVFQLAAPLDLGEGDTLVVKLGGSFLGAVRLALSPLPQVSPDSAITGFPQAALASGAKRRLGLFTLLGSPGLTAMLADERKRYWALFSDALDCHNGQASTLVTLPREPLLTKLLPRGNWQDESGAVLSPATPHFLPAALVSDNERRLTRLDLARWLVRRDNPLTARVVMNRLWKQVFGTGLSSVLNDLGGQGEPPTHPELLDWLAAEFMDSGWDMKHMVRVLVTSNAYRQDSRARDDIKEVDPLNRLYSRQNARRLDAEHVRDGALFIAGLLDPDIGGPSSRPYQPPGYYENLNFPERDWVNQTDNRQYRRGLYTHWQRTFLHPMLVNFDAPSREECTADRGISNTPQQALTLLNDPTFIEAARVFAGRILLDRSARTDDVRLLRMVLLAVGRPPRPTEKDSLLAHLATERAYFSSHPADAQNFLGIGQSKPPSTVSTFDLAAWTSVARVVLNLHETITRY